MKKILTALLLIITIFTSSASAASMILEYDGSIRNYSGNIYSLEVNGKMLTNLPLEPIVFNDRALVPVREIFEAMGAEVNYNGNEKSVTIIKKNTSVYISIDSPIAKVNNKTINIPDNVAPKLIAKWGESAKTMVPVRFISESLGMKVDFSQEKGLISISDPEAEITKKNTIEKITWSHSGKVVTVKVSATNEITEYTTPFLTEAGVLFSDIKNATFTMPSTTEINTGCVLRVRMGIHETYSRVAIDTVDLASHSVELSQDKKTLIFKITQKGTSTVPPTEAKPEATPVPTPGTTPSTKPEATPTPTPAPTPSPKPYEINLTNPIVVIDAGHGGSDPGVVRNKLTDQEMEDWLAYKEDTTLPVPSSGSGTACKEKDVALSIAKKTKRILEQNGVKVLMTRDGDTYPSLDERPALAKANHAALFLSIHANSTNDIISTANGIEVYYSLENNNDNYTLTSEAFAKSVLQSVISSTGSRNRGVKTANYLVVRKSPMPAVLIETGFFNNPEELNLLTTDAYQEKIASGLAKGILSSLPKLKLNPNAKKTTQTSQSSADSQSGVQGTTSTTQKQSSDSQSGVQETTSTTKRPPAN